MKAVIRGVLLDEEARHWPDTSDIHDGMLRESFLRRVHLARAFNARNLASSFPISDSGASHSIGQRPLSSPTVFNFFLPDHQPSGDIPNAELFAPESQIVTAVTAITSANSLRSQIFGVMDCRVYVNGELLAASGLPTHLQAAYEPRATDDRLDYECVRQRPP